MRKGFVAIGVALALVGVALWYFPLQTVSSNISIPQGKSQVVGLEAPLDLLGAPITYTLHWSSSSTSVVAVYRCGTSSTCSATGPGSLVVKGSGRTGSLSWTGPAGDYFHIIPSGPVEVTFEELEPLLGGSLGLSVLGFGAFLAVFALWLPAVPEGDRPVRRTHDEDRAPPSAPPAETDADAATPPRGDR